jgi:hypothetical protein
MRGPGQTPPLPAVYLNLLQARSPRPQQAVVLAAPKPHAHLAERVAPPASSRLPRGSLIDIKV